MVETIRTQPTAKLVFAGGINGYGFDFLVDIHRLRTRSDMKLIKNGLIKKFASSHSDSALQQLMSYAERTNDVSLRNKIKVYVSLVTTQHIISFNCIFKMHLHKAHG